MVKECKLDILNNEALTALALALRCKSNNIVHHLLQAGARPDVILTGGQTALHMACRLGNVQAVELLLWHGSDASIRDYDGLTPTDIALRCDYPKLANTIQRAIDSTKVSGESGSRTPEPCGTQDTAQESCHGELPFRLAT